MKKIFLFLISIFTCSHRKEKTGTFPPIPKWEPEFSISNETVLERIRYYFDEKKDIVIFKNGTAVIIEDGLSESDAKKQALSILSKIINYHPDMNPLKMDDNNILVQYNHPAYNVVIYDFAKMHLKEIQAKHLDALATDEVLITPLGQNKFDEFEMMALYGRTFMFMDAKKPIIIKIYRH
jgi:hypothetical protein